jgi:glycosyltransferase involved in cell wall biosynthesis
MECRKICIISTISMTQQFFIINTVESLHNAGFEIILIANDASGFTAPLPNYVKFFSVKMKRGIDFLNSITAIKSIYSILKNEKVDIVQYTTPNASLYSSIAARLAMVPVRIYSQWGIIYVVMHGLKRKIFKFIELIICMNSIVIQPDSVDNLQFGLAEGLYPRSKGEVIGNGSALGVDFKRFDVNKKDVWRKEVRKKYNISFDTKVIGFIGRINVDKGINELVYTVQELMKMHNNLCLLVVGPKDKTKGVDREVLQWLFSSQNVILTGYTSEPEKFISAMDIMLLPSYREGFGSIVIEAGALQIPTIASDIPGPRSSIIDGKTGFLVPCKSVQSLIQKADVLLEDSEIRKKMGYAAFEYAKKTFDSKVLIEKIIENRRKLLKITSEDIYEKSKSICNNEHL